VIPDAATDQTSAHDPLTGYVPIGMSVAEAVEARRTRPDEVVRRARESMAIHVRALLGMRDRGTVLFDYGNNLRGEAEKGGLPHEQAFSYPGFVPEYIRPLFCVGKGPFRWAALSGDPDDIRITDAGALAELPRRCPPAPLDPARPEARPVPGAARAHLLARLRRASSARAALQPARARGQAQGADRHRPRPSRHRLGRLAVARDRGHARRE
jgi:hypothetical protein